ncbi:MAG: hypothetical protein QM654_16635 [Dysgonamonadaceae bacterium]
MTVVSFPEFNPLSMTANTSYVVAENHSLSSNCQILEGITLYFTTGTIQGASGIKLIGKNTQVIAPIRHIFGETLEVTGSWITDKAYPQWFGAKADETHNDTSAIQACCSIFKNIRLIKGKYKVTSTILIPPGVSLRGDAGTYEEYTNPDDGINRANYIGAKIVPYDESGSNFIDGYVFFINTNFDNTWYYPYFPNTGEIRDLIIFGYKADVCRGFSVGCGITFCTVQFVGMTQAIVKNSQHYIDGLCIQQCSFTQKDGVDAPIIDCGFLGDGLRIEGCHIGGIVKLNNCNGGVIEGNIQGSYYFGGCRAIKMCGCHIEEGRIWINSSNLSIEDLFIWQLNETPDPIIDIITQDSSNASVILKNISFIYYINGIEHNHPMNDLKSAVDIRINELTTLSIEKCYKVFSNSGGIGMNQLMGITVNKADNTSLEIFNSYSAYLSDFCVINASYSLNCFRRLKTEAGAGIAILNTADFTNNPFYPWYGDDGCTYYYRAYLLWDKERRILGTASSEFVRTAGKIGCPYFISYYRGRNQTVRVYRGIKSNVYTEFCDIQFAGAYFCVDDGLSCGGGAFKWQIQGGSPIEENGIYAKYANFVNENIEVYATLSLNPTTGSWKDGDKVVALNSGKTYYCTQSGEPGVWIEI